MIIIEKKEEYIYFPIHERCKLDRCNVYQLIIQDRYTKCIFVYKLRNISLSPIRLKFKIIIPDFLRHGEYTYYLVNTNEWVMSDIDRNYILNTHRTTDKQAISDNDLYIISNGKMLVTSFFKAIITDDGDKLKEGEYTLIANDSSKDHRAYGNIVDFMTLLDSGIIKYCHPGQEICKDGCKYTTDAHKEFPSYKRC